MSKLSNYADLVAQFAAKGGTAQVIPTGAESGITTREWQSAVRGNSVAVARDVRSDRDSEANYLRAQDTAAEARMNGQSVTGYDDKGNVYTDRGRY